MAVNVFDDVRFPTDISPGPEGGPEFNTDIVRTAGGIEFRNANWTGALESWDVGYGVRTQAQLDVVRAFHRARRGMAVGFRFKVHADYIALAQLIEPVDGSDVDYQLVKHYSSGPGSETRIITKPVFGTLVIAIDDVIQTEDTDYTVDYTTGIVTFASALGSGPVVTADFEFDIAARFGSDKLPQTISTLEAQGAQIMIEEIRD